MYLIKNGEKVKISSIENYNDSHTSKNNWLLYSLLIILFIAILAGTFYLVNKHYKSKLALRLV